MFLNQWGSKAICDRYRNENTHRSRHCFWQWKNSGSVLIQNLVYCNAPIENAASMIENDGLGEYTQWFFVTFWLNLPGKLVIFWLSGWPFFRAPPNRDDWEERDFEVAASNNFGLNHATCRTLGLFLRSNQDATFVLFFICQKEKLPSHYATENWPSRDDARVLAGESVLFSNARTLCRYETSFLVYFFKVYKVVFRMPVRISKLRAGRPPKVRFGVFFWKRTNLARRVWWRHSASGPEIVARAMFTNKRRLWTELFLWQKMVWFRSYAAAKSKMSFFRVSWEVVEGFRWRVPSIPAIQTWCKLESIKVEALQKTD